MCGSGRRWSIYEGFREGWSFEPSFLRDRSGAQKGMQESETIANGFMGEPVRAERGFRPSVLEVLSARRKSSHASSPTASVWSVSVSKLFEWRLLTLTPLLVSWL
jgi:hypothetical protein